MNESTLSDLARAELRKRSLRMLKDRAFGITMAVGGVTVIVAILTIFIYLLWVVMPLFQPAHVARGSRSEVAVGKITRFALNEYADVAFVVDETGNYRFLDTASGRDLASGALVPQGATLSAQNTSMRSARTLALALADGNVLLVEPAFRDRFENNRRAPAPELVYPLGEARVAATPAGEAVTAVAAEANEDGATIVAVLADGRMVLTSHAKTESLLEEEASFESTQVELGTAPPDVAFLLIDADQQELYIAARSGQIWCYDIRDKLAPTLVNDVKVTGPGVTLTAVEFLSGGTSLLIGDSGGTVTQWFPVRDEQNVYRLTRIRAFNGLRAGIAHLLPENYRKGFAAIDQQGALGVFHTTADRTLLIDRDVLGGKPDEAAISPRADALVTLENGTLTRFEVTNEHPEVSLRSLWGKVWYEGRAGPEYIWQSSSASSDFEPKFSLTPLTFGTIKAAFYAMILAVPVAIFGAVYTAYFMAPRLRIIVKPAIEIMAALPTVILGFLAGLWLAPLIETHLIGVIGATLALPITILLSAWTWSRMPDMLRHRLPDGGEFLLLIPVICLVLWGMLELSQPLEQVFFEGNLPRWLTQHLGITYDQRNSLVVGIAMGFAVIPNIYSISEDAVFGVPRQLSTGSLALGATPWQTVTRVVLLTASPGIFSAVMIGLGRAVGETMIVLMSTGNTPIMDLNIFQGFRALSANIAVEMPESEVNSTHYRVLFLAALVLFGVTFFFNTAAEIVRQRLRGKYGNL